QSISADDNSPHLQRRVQRQARRHARPRSPEPGPGAGWTADGPRRAVRSAAHCAHGSVRDGHRFCDAVTDIRNESADSLTRPLRGPANRIKFAPSSVRQADRFAVMSEKPESDEFEDEEPAEPVPGSEDVDLDQVTKDLDMAKRR